MLEHHSVNAGVSIFTKASSDLCRGSDKPGRAEFVDVDRLPSPGFQLKCAGLDLTRCLADQKAIHQREPERGRIAADPMTGLVQTRADSSSLVRTGMEDVVLRRQLGGD